MQSDWPKGVNVIAIVPAFNEARYIANVVRQLKQRKREGLLKEVIVVDDGSRDRTGQKAMEAGADKVIRMRGNKVKAQESKSIVKAIQESRKAKSLADIAGNEARIEKHQANQKIGKAGLDLPLAGNALLLKKQF